MKKMHQIGPDKISSAIALSADGYYFYSPVNQSAERSDPGKMTLSSTHLSNDLVEGCIRNDRRAQEKLYKQYCGAMMNLCLTYTKNEEDATEVMQDGFLKVFQQINRFDSSKSTLYTWMRTVVLRTAIDFLRKKNQRPAPVEWKEAYDPVIDADAIQQMTPQEVLYMLQKLPATTRAVFNLYVVEGYNHREIGELLGMSEGTSKWHLSEARKNLSKTLKMERA